MAASIQRVRVRLLLALALAGRVAAQFTVLSGTCKAIGRCVRTQNFPQEYQHNDRCVILPPADPGPLLVTGFHTYSSTDKLTVNGQEYSLNVGPVGVVPRGEILWVTDWQNADVGWEICLAPRPPPASPPRPSSPPSPSSPPVVPPLPPVVPPGSNGTEAPSPPPLRPPQPPLPPLLPIPIEVVHYLDFESSSLPTGWHNGDDAVSGTQPWTHWSGSTPSSGTGPSSAYEGTYYMYCEVSGGAEGDVFALRFDGIGCKNITSVDWHYHMHGTNPGSLRLVYQPLGNGGRRARALTHLSFSSSPKAWEVSGPLGDQWLSASVPLGSGASSFIFEYVRADTWSGDASIDAVAVHCVLDDTPPPLPPLPIAPLAPPPPFAPPHVPPLSPEPPASPPPTLPPHLPLVHPNIVTNGTQLLAAVDAAVAGDQLEVGLLPGVSYELNGTPLAVNGFQLRLISIGRGATIDAAHLSQVVVVRGGGSLHAERVHFVNGGCTMIEVVEHSNTTLLYGSVRGQRCLFASSAPSGSATFTLNDHSRVTLVETEVNDIEVASSASLRGGVLSLKLESTAVLSHCTIRDITATVVSAEGAVINADTASTVHMTSTAISKVRTVASSWCDGSFIFLEDRCVATLSECSFAHIETTHATWGGMLFARDNSVCSLHGCLVDDFSFGSQYEVSGALTESRALSIMRINASIFINIRGNCTASFLSVFSAYDRALYEVEDCHISHCYIQAESWTGGLFSGYASGSIATPLISRHCTAFNCTARSTTADVEGVVARLYTSSLVMEGCTMELMRSVAGDGVEGGIALVYSGSRLIVRGCSFSDVEASGNHVKGGIFRVSAGNVLLLEKTAFSNLRMHTPTVAWGGLVYVAADQQETVTLSHVNLTGLAFDGLLGALGGVVWSTLAEHVVTFDSCRLERIELSSTGAHARGGVIYTELSAIAVTACDIAHVSIRGAQAAIGGVIAAASAQLSVSSTTINNCTTGGSQNTVGAAIAVYSSAFLTLRGCTITACFAEGTSLGAAVLFRSSDSRVVVRKLLITMPQECTGAFAFSGFTSPGASVLGLTIDGCVADDLQSFAFGRCSDVTYLNTVSDEVEGLCPTTAACVDAPLSLTSASATSPTCACVSPWYALATGGHEFPFLWADVLGCATARGAESLLFESDVLVVQTEKERSTGARRERTAVTLRLNGTDPTAPPTVWSTRIVIDEQAAGPWVWFAEGTGLAYSPEQAIWSLAVFTNASGLAERPEPYNAVAFIEGTAQSGAFALSMPIRLRVTAEISAAHSVWGQASGAAFCSSLPRPNRLLTVGVHAHVPFQACDADDLPVVHSPSSSPVDTDFNRTFRVFLFERAGAAPLQVLIEPLSGGTFEAELLPSIPGASTLELSLDFEGRKLFELDVRCPDRQSPLPDGSGCGCDGGYTLGAQGECVPCAEGSFKAEVSHAPCTSCAEHFGDRFRASGVRGAASAALCACVAGGFTLAAAEGGGQCLCPAGSELDAASETCVPCSAGTAKAEVSNGKCALCGRGRQQERLGQVECLVCPPGQFQSETGKATCDVCPARWNSSVGASRCDFCGRGYFLERLREGAQCSDCLPQTDCPYNSTLESLVLRTGYWRASKTSKKIYTCDRGKDGSSSCVGGSNVGRDGQGYCLVNHTGARCLGCTQEKGVYYSGDVAQCIECPAIVSRLALFLAPSIPLLAVLALLYWMQFSPLKTSLLKSFSKALRRFVLWLTSKDLMVKVKHVVGFYQVINVIPSVYAVTLPDDYHKILSFVTSFEFDYSSLVYPGKCLPGPEWARIVTTSTIPLAAICALSVMCKDHLS
ncbi:hypothetical protein AB1Y20_013781 [Prymnesium parvum]|uniref:MAM domain-containing protein n=1 Tax=Prymnesium parvum TaxID=97485 RepID=A0AB34IG22_PRYPA